MKSLSVLIPNYNGCRIIGGAVRSAQKAAIHSGCPYEIIVSDDGSTDGSVELLRKDFPYVKMIMSTINTGFPATVNRGIRQASGDLIFIMNSDLALAEDYFIPQLDYFNDEITFGVMGKICHPETKKTTDGAKYPELRCTQLVSTLNYVPAGTPAGFRIPTLFLSGANALIDRKKITLLGGMDEIYSPFYMEDVDLGVRAWRMGWRCYFNTSAVCYHNISSTIRTHYTAGIIRMISKRNKFLFNDVHFEGLNRFCWHTETAINILFRWLVLDVRFYRSYMQYLQLSEAASCSRKNFSGIMQKNKQPLSLRQVADAIKKQVSGYDLEFF